MTFSSRRKHPITAQPSYAWRATTNRFARRALILLAGFMSASPMQAQSPYQPNRAADNSTTQAAVAVPTKNAAVPTFTFQRADAPTQEVITTTMVPVVVNEMPTVQTTALPSAPVPTIVFQAVGEAPQRIQPVAAPMNSYNTTIRAPRITAPLIQQSMMQQSMVRPEVVAAPIVQTQGINQDQGDNDSLQLKDLGIEVDPPKGDRLFRLESEAALRSRIADERRGRPAKGIEAQSDVEFPPYGPLSDKPFENRAFAGVAKQIEPNYVIYGRLYAEEVNSERYGWDTGAIQPFLSTAIAFKDMAFIPYNFAARPCQCYETSAGKCYPGDPVPYLIYPMELSVTGAAWETAVILGLVAIIP